MSSDHPTRTGELSRRDVLRKGAVATAVAGLGLSGFAGSAAAGGDGNNGDTVPDDAIPIDGPTEITEPGYYVLTQDIAVKEPMTVIYVESGVSDVTIDGRGHCIKGPGKGLQPGSTGIRVGQYLDSGTPDAVVKNVIVTGFREGIALGDTDRANVCNVKVTHCNWGFELYQNRDLTIADSIVAKNGYAFFQDEGSRGIALLRNRVTRNEAVGGFDFADGAIIKNNRVDYNDSGLDLINSTGSEIVGNLFYQNRDGFGITEYVGRGSDNVVRGNRFIENDRYGVIVDGSNDGISGVLIAENDVLRNGEAGIELFYRVRRSTLSKNRIIGNGGDGVLLTESDENEIVGNLIRQNGGDGIELRSSEYTGDGSDDNVIRENIIRENGDEPITIDENSTGNVVEDNRIGDDAPNVCSLDSH